MRSRETQLQHNLNRLRTRLLVMSAAVGIAVDEACAALATGNTGRAVAVIDGDAAVNALENEIDELALSLLVRNQPVAQDLRLVVGALRMVIDLERIGDEAASIAERAVILHEKPPERIMTAIAGLTRAAKDAYQRAVTAFRDEDATAALEIIENDDECVQKEVAALHEIMEHFRSGPPGARNSRSQTGMHGILVCRSLNRICRRSANMAEHVYFIARGVNIKHAPLPERE